MSNSRRFGDNIAGECLSSVSWLGFARGPDIKEATDLCVKDLADQHGKTLTANAEGETNVQAVVKPISVQSVTMFEFFLPLQRKVSSN
jgi:hypothetical protein